MKVLNALPREVNVCLRSDRYWERKFDYRYCLLEIFEKIWSKDKFSTAGVSILLNVILALLKIQKLLCPKDTDILSYALFDILYCT